MSHDEAARRRLPASALTPALGRPGDAHGLLASAGERRFLLDLAGRGEDDIDAAVRVYLDEGLATGVADRYKCRMRRPWYAVPVPRRIADAFLPYMAQLGPRLIVNDLGARSSNLLHGVFFGPSAPTPRALAAAMTSAMTLLSAEIEGRAYGGGVLKLETREAERLLVPSLTSEQAARLEECFGALDARVRAGDVKGAALMTADVLGIDHEAPWDAYLRLRQRRLERKRVKAA